MNVKSNNSTIVYSGGLYYSVELACVAAMTDFLTAGGNNSAADVAEYIGDYERECAEAIRADWFESINDSLKTPITEKYLQSIKSSVVEEIAFYE